MQCNMMQCTAQCTGPNLQCNAMHRKGFTVQDQLCNAMHGQGCMREGFRHWFRVNNPLKLISVAFQLVFPIHPLTAVIASFAEDNYSEGLSGCCVGVYVHPAIGVLGSFEASQAG